MKGTAPLRGVGFLCGLLVLLSPVAAAAGAADASWEKSTLESGLEIYNLTCVACHGEDGKGAVPGAPADIEARLAQPDDVLFEHVEDGFQSPGAHLAMPARGGLPSLTDQELIDAICYMRSKFGGETAVESACPD